MSSLIPLRRTTRVSRNATKDNENANARPSRLATRSKPLGSVATDASTGATAIPAVSKASTGGPVTKPVITKRKREALAEIAGVSNNNRKSKDAGIGKGKEKEKSGTREEVTAKTIVPSRTTRESVRAHEAGHRPTRSTSVTVTSQAAESTVKAGVRDLTKTVRSSRPGITTRNSLVKLTDDAEAERVFKRRHTELPAEKHLDESQIDVERVAADLEDIEPELEPVAEVQDLEPIVEDDKPQLWDDLDANDWDDPVMVSEYVADVCVYLKEVEKSTCPDSDYMSKHQEIDWEKRGILVDWILQVHARFNLLQETLFLFINILDRFLSSRPISLSKFQLVGITAFFIAAKYEETYAPSVSEIARLADDMYSIDDILRAERYILKTLDWDLRYPGPLGWLRRGSKADDCEIKARTVGKYLIEIGCLEWRLVGTVPSLLAAAAMWLARLVLGREEWTSNMEHYMTYTEEEILPTANIILNYILEPIQHESLYKKYAHKRYLKCSAFMRHWALERWPESTTVDLATDLPALKEDIRLEREALKAAKETSEADQ